MEDQAVPVIDDFDIVPAQKLNNGHVEKDEEPEPAKPVDGVDDEDEATAPTIDGATEPKANGNNDDIEDITPDELRSRGRTPPGSRKKFAEDNMPKS